MPDEKKKKVREFYIIVYTPDCGGVYTRRYNSRALVDRWLERNEYKAQVITVRGRAKIEDHT